jgi:hypothetical protein
MRARFGGIESDHQTLEIGGAPESEPLGIEHLGDRRTIREAEILRGQHDLEGGLRLRERREGVVLHDPPRVGAYAPHRARPFEELGFANAADGDRHGVDKSTPQAGREWCHTSRRVRLALFGVHASKPRDEVPSLHARS